MRRLAIAAALVIGALVAGSVVLASRGHHIGRSTSMPAATARALRESGFRFRLAPPGTKPPVNSAEALRTITADLSGMDARPQQLYLVLFKHNARTTWLAWMTVGHGVGPFPKCPSGYHGCHPVITGPAVELLNAKSGKGILVTGFDAAVPTARPSLSTDLQLTKSVPCGAGYYHLVGPKIFRRFHAVTAVLCTEGRRTYPGQGQWEVIVRRVAVSGIPAFQRYFEQPDEPNLPRNGGCTADLRGIFVPTFVDGQARTLVPRTAVDRCGHPVGLPKGQKPTRVRWHVVWVHRIKQVVSARAVAAGCPMEWGNSVAWAGPPRDSTGGPLFAHAPRTVRICIFRTPPDRFAVGHFVRGFRLDASHTRRLLGALTGAGPRRGCAKQRTFAVLSASAGSVANVELGGCYRVDRPDRLAGTANPAVVRAILGVR